MIALTNTGKGLYKIYGKKTLDDVCKEIREGAEAKGLDLIWKTHEEVKQHQLKFAYNGGTFETIANLHELLLSKGLPTKIIVWACSEGGKPNVYYKPELEETFKKLEGVSE
jgi:hypothetical protein